jgi:hypothetical protein
MALNTNPFVEGIDPTSTFGGYASVLLQLIRQAQPSSTYGMILFDTTAPDVTGANAWRKRSLWLNLTTPATPTVNVYREGGSPGWVNVNDVISPNTITTAMIQNAAVTLAKLSTAGGTANQLIRVNAGATGFEFVSVSGLITTGSINVGSLITTGIPAGQFRLAGTYGPGVANWYTAQNVIDNLANASIASDLIAPAGGATTRSKFLSTRTGDPFAAWRFLEPNVDILDTTLSGAKLQNGTVDPVKIVSSGIPDGYLLSKVAGIPDWVAPTAVAGIVASKQVVEITPLPASNTPTDVITYAATGGKADIYQFYLKCITADHGFDPGDEIPLGSLGNDDGGANEAGPLIFFDASASKVIHRGPAFYQVQSATASTIVSIATVAERARWALKCVAIRFA